MNKEIKTIAVYCGASNKVENIYKEETKKLGLALAEKELDLVFGSGNIGLMGIISNTMSDKNRKVIGITTTKIESGERENPSVTEKVVVNNLRERKAKMDELCDAVIALPGGFGTLDEVGEMIALKQIGSHNKPIVLFDINGFWDNLVATYQGIIDKKFAKEDHINLFRVAKNIDEVIEAIYEEQHDLSEENWRL